MFQVGLSILSVAVSSYAGVCVIWELRDRCPPSIMIWVGVSTVLGSVTGALICMLLTLVFQVFQEMDPCADYVEWWSISRTTNVLKSRNNLVSVSVLSSRKSEICLYTNMETKCFFSIWNHHKCHIFPLHLNIYDYVYLCIFIKYIIKQYNNKTYINYCI